MSQLAWANNSRRGQFRLSVKAICYQAKKMREHETRTILFYSIFFSFSFFLFYFLCCRLVIFARPAIPRIHSCIVITQSERKKERSNKCAHFTQSSHHRSRGYGEEKKKKNLGPKPRRAHIVATRDDDTADDDGHVSVCPVLSCPLLRSDHSSAAASISLFLSFFLSFFLFSLMDVREIIEISIKG
jgi:hypothetical protein